MSHCLQRLCRTILVTSTTLLLVVGCSSPRVGSGLAAVIGGGELPNSQGSLLKDISKNRARAGDTEPAPDVIAEETKEGRVAYRRATSGNPDYFGRSTQIIPRAGPEIAPAFTADGTCLRCNGRGFRFSDARDYDVCESCDGDGHR